MKRRSMILSGAAIAALPYKALQAQEAFPAKPIRIIVPYPAGGVVDVQTRAMAQGLELGQPVVIEARPGANANIAAEAVARANADGYTLLVSAPYLLNNPLLEQNLRWAPKDFIPVARFSLSPSYLCVPASSPARSVRDFVDMARKANPALQYGDGGSGTTQTMATEILKQVTGIKLDPIPYKGAPPMAVDLITNTFAVGILPSSVAFPHIKSGKLRALANTSANRSPQLPEVPTIAEAGFPEVTVLSWYGLHAPAGTPPEAIRKLEAGVQAALQKNDTKERLTTAGGEAAFLSTADFSQFMRNDLQMWERINRMLKK
jgi:tripartite-type tricarboxylate transporter receptor subunit TctC